MIDENKRAELGFSVSEERYAERRRAADRLLAAVESYLQDRGFL